MALTTNLQAYYKLDESSGNATDSSGNGYTGTNTSVTYSAGKINNGALFNGSSAFLDMGVFVQLTGDYTLSVWIKPTTIPGAGVYPMLLARRTEPATNGDYNILMNGDISGKFNYSLRDSAAWKGLTSTTIPTAGNWYHVVITKLGTLATMYVNGVSEATDNTFPVTPVSATPNFFLGKATSGGNFLDAMEDEVGVWSRALSSAEVTELYNGGAGLQYPFSTTTFTPQMIII